MGRWGGVSSRGWSGLFTQTITGAAIAPLPAPLEGCQTGGAGSASASPTASAHALPAVVFVLLIEVAATACRRRLVVLRPVVGRTKVVGPIVWLEIVRKRATVRL